MPCFLDGKSYAYATLNLEEKEEKIQELGELLRPYTHLTNINLSGNDLKNVDEVMHLRGLLQLKALGN